MRIWSLCTVLIGQKWTVPYSGNLIPVYTVRTDGAEVDCSVLQFAEVGGRLILTLARYVFESYVHGFRVRQ